MSIVRKARKEDIEITIDRMPSETSGITAEMEFVGGITEIITVGTIGIEGDIGQGGMWK